MDVFGLFQSRTSSTFAPDIIVNALDLWSSVHNVFRYYFHVRIKVYANIVQGLRVHEGENNSL